MISFLSFLKRAITNLFPSFKGRQQKKMKKEEQQNVSSVQSNQLTQQEKRKKEEEDSKSKQDKKWSCCKIIFQFIQCIFACIVAIVIGYFSGIGPVLMEQIQYQYQWYISCQSIQCQLVEFMNTTITNNLMTPKFYKDSVYSKLKNSVQKSLNSNKTFIITGKSQIGKSTSMIEISNQLMTNGFPVFYISLKGSPKIKQASKIFQQMILNNQMFNLLKQWRTNQISSRYANRFNQHFNNTFLNKNPIIIIDQINIISQLCQPKCPQKVQLFFENLIMLRSRGTSIILLSSDPYFFYFQKISGMRFQKSFNVFQVSVNEKQDFNQMFSQYNVNQSNKKYILNYLDSRGQIIDFLLTVIQQYGNINLTSSKQISFSNFIR